jgi:mRNA-degrading endonuclease YafQ of YafQ-DinJ toxin-antitoxin module
MGAKITRIEYSQKFLKSLKKLPSRIITNAEEKEKLFRDNPYLPILKTHRLLGEKTEAWAFWINYSYRIKFIFIDDDSVLFLDIGTHNIYKFH